MDFDTFDSIAESAFNDDTLSVESQIARMAGKRIYELHEIPKYRIKIIQDTFVVDAVCDICNKNEWAYHEGEFICNHSDDEEYYMIGIFVGRIINESKVVSFTKVNGEEE